MGSENNMVAVPEVLKAIRGIRGAARYIAVGDGAYDPWPSNVEAVEEACDRALARLAQPDAQQGASSPASGEGVERAVATPVDDEVTRAFIDGWNARFDYTDFDRALHFWMLSTVAYVGATPLAAATQPAGAQEVERLRNVVRDLTTSLDELLTPLERASAEMVAHGKPLNEAGEAAFDRARAAIRALNTASTTTRGEKNDG